MTTRQEYDEMIRSVVGPELKREGFKRIRNRFARRRDGGWQIIDFQASSWGSRDELRFTINLASALEGLPKRSAWDETKPPPEYGAHLRERIGELLDGRDVWWDFDARTEADALAAALLGILRSVGIPWLEARAGLDAVLTLISHRPRDLGWHDLEALPPLLDDAGLTDAAQEVRAEGARRRSRQ
jgi:hypothetical protein